MKQQAALPVQESAMTPLASCVFDRAAVHAVSEKAVQSAPPVQASRTSTFSRDFSRVRARAGSPPMVQRQQAVEGGARGEEPDEEVRDELEGEGGGGAIFTAIAQLKRLVVGSPGDIYEREADRVADQVTRRGTDEPLAELYRSETDVPLAAVPLPIQRVPNHPQPRAVDLSFDQSGGQPLDQRVQRDMESRFGYGFESVRVHNDSESQRLARALDARAFTVGSNIYFGRGEYDLTSTDGKHLLAHELTHVVQQGKATPPDSSFDREIIPMSVISRAVRKGDVNPTHLARLPRVQTKGTPERTKSTHSYRFGPAQRGASQRHALQTDGTVVQMTNGGGASGGGTPIRAEASFALTGWEVFGARLGALTSYSAAAWVEGTPNDSGCQFVGGSITPDKRTVGGFSVTVGTVTERETNYQEDDEGCPDNDNKHNCFRYYVHFAAVQGIGVSVSKVAGVSGAWITAQHDHTADLRICAGGSGSATVSSVRTKGPGGDVITRNYGVTHGTRSSMTGDTVVF